MEWAQSEEERERHLDRAIALYEKIRDEKLSDDPFVEYYLTRLYNQKVKRAQERKEQLSARERGEGELERLEGEIALYRGKISQFFLTSGLDDVRAYEAAISADPQNPLYYYLYARVLIDQNAWMQAIRMLKKAIKLDEEYVEAYLLLGDLFVQRERYFQAAENYRRAWETV